MIHPLRSSLHLAGLLSSLVLLTACVTAQAPEESGGVPLPGTENAVCDGPGDPFWVSPDGEFLIYRTTDHDPAFPRYAAFSVTDWDIGHDSPVREVINSDETAALAGQGRGPEPSLACWTAKGLAFAGHGVAFQIDPTAVEPRLEVLQEMPCTPTTVEGPSGVTVEKPALTTARLVAADGKILAEHRAHGAGTSHVVVEQLVPSPDGRALAYHFIEFQSGFVKPSQGFLLHLTAPDPDPQRLATPVFGPFRWGPEGRHLYACAGDEPGAPRLVRWWVAPDDS
jgi:hypothetical protein